MNNRIGPQWIGYVGQHLQEWEQPESRSIFNRLGAKSPFYDTHGSPVPHVPVMNRLSRDNGPAQHHQHNNGSVFSRLLGPPSRKRLNARGRTKASISKRKLRAERRKARYNETRKGRAHGFKTTVAGETSARAAIALLSDAPADTTDWDWVIQEAIDEVKITEQEIEQKECVLGLVEETLNYSFPRAICRLFGSSVTRLGFKDSDADINIALGCDPFSHSSLGDGRAKAAKLTKQLAACFVNHAEFRRVNLIANCRVPLIKLYHKPSHTLVDLSFRSNLGVANSSFVRLLCDSHPQVRPFIMFLRLWSTAHKVSGPAKPAQLFTSYTLSLLALFTCMAREQKLVPSLDDLRKLSYDSSVIDCWECGYGTDVAAYWQQEESGPPTSVEGGVLRLALEFFEFYGGLDYERWAVCPLVGRLVDKNALWTAADGEPTADTGDEKSDCDAADETVFFDDDDDCLMVDDDDRVTDDVADCVIIDSGSTDVVMLAEKLATDADDIIMLANNLTDADATNSADAIPTVTAASADTVTAEVSVTAGDTVQDSANITDTVSAAVTTDDIIPSIDKADATSDDNTAAATCHVSDTLVSPTVAATSDSNNLPQALLPYLSKIKLMKRKKAPLCVIDLFALDNNVTSQYLLKSINSFQNKCNRSAEIIKEILKKEKPLSALFADFEDST